MSKKKLIIMLISLALILLMVFIVYGYYLKPQSANPDESIFGKQEEEVAQVFGWDFKNAEKIELSSDELAMQSGNLSGYILKLQNVTLYGKTAQQVWLQFMGSNSINMGLTFLLAEYGANENMDQVADELTKIWGESRDNMYCTWPGRIYLQNIWAGNFIFDSPNSFAQSVNDEKQLWGSLLTIGDSLEGQENPEAIYEEWSKKFSRIYAQSLKNDWKDIEKEPLITAVLFRNSDEYKRKNTIVLDGFNLFVSKH